MRPTRLFLIGAAKCGTTTVDQMLRLHPEVFMSPIKEPNYYSTDINPDNFTEVYRKQSLHDLDAYFAQEVLEPMHLDFVRSPQQYADLYRAANGAAVLGESSTSYLVSKEAAENIAKDYPDAKFVVCLRNPVSRLKSHLKMALQGGNITEISDEVVEADMKKPNQGWGSTEMFLPLGMYGMQLEHWLKVFPKAQFHFVFFDDLIENQQKVFDDLCAFLNVSIFALDSEVHANAGGMPRFPKLNAFLKGSKRVRNIKDRMPESWKAMLKAQWNDEAAVVNIDENRWKEYYRKDIEKLESLLGLTLEHWK